MRRVFLVASLFIFSLNSGESYGVTVDFEQFNVGDDLTTVNAALAPLGVTFDAAFPTSFEVVLDPGDAGNKVVRAKPFGAAGAVDFVANFSQLVESVSVEFVTNPDPVSLISLEGYTANQSASALNVADFALQDSAFVSTGTLQIAWSTFFAPPSQLRAATMGVASGGAPAFNYIDNLTFTPIPEPGSIVLLGCAVLFSIGRKAR
ncbi:MAG: hypothetical protein MI725_12205 [Pirellulales bacterium]|nr:hypothetical protein [Pirellulales bacterium]